MTVVVLQQQTFILKRLIKTKSKVVTVLQWKTTIVGGILQSKSISSIKHHLDEGRV
jgi:hypothetical protein